MNPVLTKIWDLRVKSLLEQWPVVCKSSNSSTGGTTPKDQVLAVRLGGSEVKGDFGNPINWTSDVLTLLA